jgi:hypothetical protein
VFSDTLEMLYRSAPPALSLALAMTEKHGKIERVQIMRKHGCGEREPAYVVAECLAA